ncbi:hypothetical protein [Streptomyces sp. NBC_01589]|uniref:hypothetical protein n=1 Tax=unclassified Streptomyces TaxID=2593676 RepID=UPI00386E4CA5
MLVLSVLKVHGPDAALPVFPAVEELIGHPAHTFRQWVHERRPLLIHSTTGQ